MVDRHCCFVSVNSEPCTQEAEYEVHQSPTPPGDPYEGTDCCAGHLECMLTDADHHVVSRIRKPVMATGN